MIEYFQINNKEELQELKNKSAKYKGINFSFSDKYIVEMQKLLDAPNGYQLFARDENGKSIGYISGAETIHPGYFTIYELFVDPEQQSKGIGSELTLKIFEHAKKKNLKGVITQTEFENIPAQKFYEKLGFIQVNNPEWDDGITYKLKFKQNKK